MAKQANKSDLFGRDISHFETDKAAVQAIVQAAVNVELFTIPLYMASLYSLQGVHQINSQNSNWYQGRLWPGLAPSYSPGSLGNVPENEKAFNTIFSVFVEEMLHLQMASNLANLVGVAPKFTTLSPQSANYAWNCFGPDKTMIPYILDFKDCHDPYSQIKVKLDALNLEQNELFLAIEEPEDIAELRIKKENIHKYFPTAPFKDWIPGEDLPMFGTIGQMYQCLWDYLDITYKIDNENELSLWEKLYQPSALQRDLFNTVSGGHPYKEYQELATTVSGWLPEKAKDLVFKLICAITDQGEGAGIKKTIRGPMLTAVQPVNQASEVALKADYPSFTDDGKPAPSAKAHARFGNGQQDHYERFQETKIDLEANKIVTWDNWRKGEKNKWTAADLKGKDYAKNTHKLPSAESIADALNRLGNPTNPDGTTDTQKLEANYKQFCQIATGAIAGITSVLDSYWENSAVGFPYPSMGGSGDRLMMCWAVFGRLPDLSVGVQQRIPNTLYHACQGMDLNENATTDIICGSPEVYHNCRGSNTCRAEGGCGFVQEVGKSQTCGSLFLSAEAGCGIAAPAYSAPADNMCASFGGCAVPISASQIYPDFTNTDGQKNVGAMELNDFPAPQHKTQRIPGRVVFNSGDFVYDIAWDAYTKVLEYRNPDAPIPVKPEPSDIRIVFPPST
ncbi:MAG: ferritin-like domain-containing protein [Saprospiraceae bacterium]